jgi:phospholipid/cholesterol/gamma-HCH transport system permease protein
MSRGGGATVTVESVGGPAPRPSPRPRPQPSDVPPQRPVVEDVAKPATTFDAFGEAVGKALPGPIRDTVKATGELYSMFGAGLYGLFSDIAHRKFKFGEFLDRAWFLISVTLLPAMLVSIPLGVSIALQVGALASQIGASNFVGAADAIGVLREAAPIVTALLLAGVGGSAVCAELGARTIREEIDAMIVLGLNPMRRLVAPLMVAGIFASGLLCFVVIFVSVTSAYVFDLAALHGTKGAFFGSFTQFASMPDYGASVFKAMVFGLVAVMIAAYLGLNAKRGPTGVGEAVNKSVVITGIVLFALNLVITEIFFAIFPPRAF